MLTRKTFGHLAHFKWNDPLVSLFSGNSLKLLPPYVILGPEERVGRGGEKRGGEGKEGSQSHPLKKNPRSATVVCRKS